MKKYSLIFLLSVYIAFVPDILALCASMVSNGTIFLGNLSKYSETCEGKEGDSICYKKYRIPAKNLKTGSNDRVLGLGFFAVTPVIYCASDVNKVSRNVANLNYIDAFKVYKSSNIETLKCEDSDALIIEAWGPQNFKKVGQLGSSALIAPEKIIESLRRMTEATSGALYLVIALALILVLATNFFVFGNLTNLSQMQSFGGYTNRVIIVTTVFAAFKSGIFDLFILPSVNTFFLMRVQHCFSVLMHVWIVAAFTQGENAKKRTFKLEVLLKFFVVSIFFATNLEAHLLIGLGIIWTLNFFNALKGANKAPLMAYAIIFAVEYSKFWFHDYMPTGMTTIYFVLLVVAADMARRIFIAGQYVWLLGTQADKVSSEKNIRDSIDLLKMFEILKVDRISLIKLNRIGNGDVMTIERKNGRISITNSVFEHLPPMLAHVATVKKNFIVEPVQNFVGSTLIRENKDELGSCFSILQVSIHNELQGFICLSKYSSIPNKTYEQDIHKFAANVLVQKFTDYYEASNTIKSNKWFVINTKIQDHLKEIANSTTKEVYGALCKAIGLGLSMDVVLGRFTRSTGMLDFIGSNLTEDSMKFLFFADKWNLTEANLSGPAAIAMNMKENVVIQNTSVIFGVVSERTKKVLNDGGVRGIVAMPIELPTGDEFFIWIQSKNENEIDDSMTPALENLRKIVTSFLHSRTQIEFTQELLAGVYRPEIRKRFVDGAMPAEVKSGFLTMIDIAGSTKIVPLVGAKEWNNIVREVGHEIGISLGMNNSVLELTIWDAFFIHTTATEDLSLQAIENAKIFSKLIEEKLNNGFLKRGHTISVKTRTCLVWGDCSTRFGEKGWEIIGSAMASAMKIEQSVKRESADFFYSLRDEFVAPKAVRLEGVEDPVRGCGVYVLEPALDYKSVG